MPVSARRAVPGLLLSLSLALAACGWEVPPVEELPPLMLSPDAGTPARPPATPLPTTPTTPTGPLPDAPTGVVATAGDASVRVRWNEATATGCPSRATSWSSSRRAPANRRTAPVSLRSPRR